MKLRFLILLMAVVLAYGQEKSKPDSVSVECAISTSDLVWTLGKASPKISVEARPRGVSSAMPALYLIASSRKGATSRQEYWAPFDFTTGSSTAAWQDLSTASRITTNLNPAELLWAQTKSSVWPSKSLSDIVSAGRYTLRLEVEVKDGKAFSSNPIEITIAK